MEPHPSQFERAGDVLAEWTGEVTGAAALTVGVRRGPCGADARGTVVARPASTDRARCCGYGISWRAGRGPSSATTCLVGKLPEAARQHCLLGYLPLKKSPAGWLVSCGYAGERVRFVVE